MRKKINWIPALVLSCVALPLDIFNSFYTMVGDTEAAEGWLVLYLLVAIATIVFECILLYKIWETLPASYRKITPGKAVGFMFIPFYNFYWVFENYISLVRGYYEYGKQTRKPEIKDLYSLGVTYAILFNCMFAIGFISGLLEEGQTGPLDLLSIFCSIASLVIFILLFKQLTEYANMILISSPGIIPVPPPQPGPGPGAASAQTPPAFQEKKQEEKTEQTPEQSSFNKDGNTPPVFQEKTQKEKISLDCKL